VDRTGVVGGCKTVSGCSRFIRRRRMTGKGVAGDAVLGEIVIRLKTCWEFFFFSGSLWLIFLLLENEN
jgi:hypothetical protein